MRRQVWTLVVLAVSAFANLNQIDLFHYHLKIFKDAFDDSSPQTLEDLLTVTTSPITTESNDEFSLSAEETGLVEWGLLLTLQSDPSTIEPTKQGLSYSTYSVISEELHLEEDLETESSSGGTGVIVPKSENLSGTDLDDDLDDDQREEEKTLDNTANKTLHKTNLTHERNKKPNPYSEEAVEDSQPNVDVPLPNTPETPVSSSAAPKREARKSHHKGLREVSAMKPGYYEAPLRLIHSNKNNEYRDPELSDAPIKSTSKTQNESSDLKETKSSKQELLDSISDVELSKKGLTQDPTIVQPIEEAESAAASPVVTDVDYVTNYIEDSGFVHPPSYEPPKNAKKAKWVYMEGVANVNEHQETDSRPEKKKERAKSENNSAGGVLESLIESDPSLRKKPEETTTAYFERIYPKIKEIMDKDKEKDKLKKKDKINFLWDLLRRKQKSQSSSAEKEPTRSLIFRNVFNMTIFKGCFEPSESAASLPMESVSSIVGAVVVILILSM